MSYGPWISIYHLPQNRFVTILRMKVGDRKLWFCNWILHKSLQCFIYNFPLTICNYAIQIQDSVSKQILQHFCYGSKCYFWKRCIKSYYACAFTPIPTSWVTRLDWLSNSVSDISAYLHHRSTTHIQARFCLRWIDTHIF